VNGRRDSGDSGGSLQIHIRHATPPDAASLATAEIESWRAAYTGLMPSAFLSGLSHAEKTESWRQTLLKHGAAGRKRVLVAVRDATAIGFVRVGCDTDKHEVGLVYLLYVLPEYWRHGMGSGLMRAAMDELRNLGTREAILWVLRDNQRARAFYEGLGWRPDGRRSTENFGGVELEALCYQRAVQNSVT
jgi:RimJ/RimL family protein N-acetyltransferase